MNPCGAALGPAAELGAEVATAPSAENGHLKDLHLVGPSGQPIELSTQFEPATMVYGAMVSEVKPSVANPPVIAHMLPVQL